MDRVTLTAAYLDEVKRRDLHARQMIGSQADSDVLRALYRGRYLSRPLFLGAGEQAQLHRDLENLRSALVSIPDRLFGADLAAFARAAGMTDVQVSAILRCRGTAVTRMSRADLYVDHRGRFQLLEFNMGSALGGVDNADMARSLLEHPVLAEFAEAHRLDYVDTLREQARTIFAECGVAPGSRPVMVAADSPSSFKIMGPYTRLRLPGLRELGFDAHCCHIGQLDVRDGGVWLGDKRVDIINRLFLIEDLLEYPEAPALAGPILDAVARGWVKMFTPIDSGLYSSKGALAMLSDEENRQVFSPDELASIDRILPWTRMVRPGPVTLENGRRADLLQHALSHRHNLALKPTAMHGGLGVLLGWHPDTTEQMWEEQVRAALDGPYVVQRRIRPAPELFPGGDGELTPWIVCWGAFTVASGYGGIYCRATTVESNDQIIAVRTGAHSGTCLHARE